MPDSKKLDLRSRVQGFHDQLMLSQGAFSVPEGWVSTRCLGWHLASHPSLPVIRLLSAEGEEAGIMVGHPIDAQGRLLRGEERLPPTASQGGAAGLEQWLYAFGGRFACALLRPGLTRFYVDAYGSLGAVWCPQRRRLASTPTLLLHEEEHHPLFREGHRALPRNLQNQFFPAGLTAAEGVRRVLPNHYLDLTSWEARRHHPKAPYSEMPEQEIPGFIAHLHEVLRRHVGALVRECGGVYLGLTAGNDSRRILACSRDHLEGLECVTMQKLQSPWWSDNAIDLETTRRMARDLGFRHRVLPTERIPRHERQDHLLRIGFSGGQSKSGKFTAPARRHLDLSRAWMSGWGGGIGRPFFARRMRHTGKPSPSELLAAMDLPPQPGFLEALEEWIDGVPEGPPGLYLDLALLEQHGGGWAGAHLYGFAPFRITLLPMCHRELFDAMLRLPAAYREVEGVTRDLLAHAWPELLAYPVNDYRGPKRWLRKQRQSLGALKRRLQGRES